MKKIIFPFYLLFLVSQNIFGQKATIGLNAGTGINRNFLATSDHSYLNPVNFSGLKVIQLRSNQVGLYFCYNIIEKRRFGMNIGLSVQTTTQPLLLDILAPNSGDYSLKKELLKIRHYALPIFGDLSYALREDKTVKALLRIGIAPSYVENQQASYASNKVFGSNITEVSNYNLNFESSSIGWISLIGLGFDMNLGKAGHIQILCSRQNRLNDNESITGTTKLEGPDAITYNFLDKEIHKNRFDNIFINLGYFYTLKK